MYGKNAKALNQEAELLSCFKAEMQTHFLTKYYACIWSKGQEMR